MPREQRTKKPAQKPERAPKNKRRHAEVIDAAVKRFYENGYSDTSVEDIANELGILKGSLYYYITSKEDLLYEIVRGVNSEVAALLARALEDDHLPPLERLTNYVIAQVDYNANNIQKLTVYYDDLPLLGPSRLKEIRRTLHEIEQGVTHLILEAQQRGDIDASLDPALATYAVFAPLAWMYRWYKPRKSVGPEAIAEFLSQFMLSGLTGTRAPLAALPDGQHEPATGGFRPRLVGSAQAGRAATDVVAQTRRKRSRPT